MLSAVAKTGVQLYSRRVPLLLSCERSLSSEHVRVDGRNIHVVRVGGGPHPLLLLPGALGSASTDFAPQLAGFDQVGLA
jgi:valacyclovir hydrolase